MRVLWPHSFPQGIRSSGVFMYSLLRSLRDRGVNIEPHYLSNLRTPLGVAKAVRELRKKASGFDIVHAQYGSVCGWVASFTQSPKLITIRGTDVYGIERGPWRLRAHGQIAKIATRQCLGKYDHVISVSKEMLSRVGMDRSEKVSIIPTGIDLTKFQPVTQSVARSQLGTRCTKPWVIVAATFKSNPIKRWELAHEAVEQLREHRPDVQLKTISNIDHDQMPLWMNAADVVLVTSTHEGWPNVVKEALACNTPFVSTDVSDLKEIAAQTQTCAVTPANGAALAQGLARALEGGKQENLRPHVESMDLDRTAMQIYDHYKRLLDSCPATLSVAPVKSVAEAA